MVGSASEANGENTNLRMKALKVIGSMHSRYTKIRKRGRQSEVAEKGTGEKETP